MENDLYINLFGNIRQCDFYIGCSQLIDYVANHEHDFPQLKVEQKFLLHKRTETNRYRILYRNFNVIKFSIITIEHNPDIPDSDDVFYINRNRDYLVNAYEDWIKILIVLDELKLKEKLLDILIQLGFISNTALLMNNLI